jgi:hypothetical protein
VHGSSGAAGKNTGKKKVLAACVVSTQEVNQQSLGTCAIEGEQELDLTLVVEGSIA